MKTFNTEDIAEALVSALYAGTPIPAGCRVNHARGILVEGCFKPSPHAGLLSSATVFAGPDRKILARFSSSGASQDIAQDNAQANPRGLAIRFGESPALTLIGHSIEGFPARNPLEFLSFVEALNQRWTEPGVYERHLGEHAGAREFVRAQAHRPTSFATLQFHMLHPYCLTSNAGESVVGRLFISGVANQAPQSTGSHPGPDYLDRELSDRLTHDEGRLQLIFQPTADDSQVDDLSAPWPNHSNDVVLGQVLIERIARDQVRQRTLVFNPAELPPGVSFAGDPMIAARVVSYYLAARRRVGESL